MSKYGIGEFVVVNSAAQGTASEYGGQRVKITRRYGWNNSLATFAYEVVADDGKAFPVLESEMTPPEAWKRVAYKEAKSHFNAKGDQCIYLPASGGNYVTVAVMGQADFGGADAKQVERLAAKIQDFLNREVGQDL